MAEFGDFTVYYGNALQARVGIDPNLLNDFAPYAYPVFFLSLLIPMTLLPLGAALKAWWFLNALCFTGLALAVALWLHRQKGFSGPLTRYGVAPLAAASAVLCFLPAYDTMLVGQNNLMVLILISATCLLCAKGRRRWAGLTMAVAILCKGQPVVLLPALLPALGWGGMASCAAVGIAYLAFLFGSGLWQWEWRLFSEVMPFWASHPLAPTISIFHRLPDLPWAETANVALYARTMELSIGVLYLAGVAFLWRKRVHWIWILSWGISCTLLMSRFLEYHHLTLLLIPLLALLVEGERRNRAEPYVYFFIVLLMTNIGFLFRNFTVPGYAWYCLGALPLCAAAIVRIGLTSKKTNLKSFVSEANTMREENT